MADWLQDDAAPERSASTRLHRDLRDLWIDTFTSFSRVCYAVGQHGSSRSTRATRCCSCRTAQIRQRLMRDPQRHRGRPMRRVPRTRARTADGGADRPRRADQGHQDLPARVRRSCATTCPTCESGCSGRSTRTLTTWTSAGSWPRTSTSSRRSSSRARWRCSDYYPQIDVARPDQRQRSAAAGDPRRPRRWAFPRWRPTSARAAR